jgi:hypothetical protein
MIQHFPPMFTLLRHREYIVLIVVVSMKDIRSVVKSQRWGGLDFLSVRRCEAKEPILRHGALHANNAHRAARPNSTKEAQCSSISALPALTRKIAVAEAVQSLFLYKRELFVRPPISSVHSLLRFFASSLEYGRVSH